ncbi:NACHT domain protein [Apiospora kogelbergensis]|uniref:NACHT domain protein n=1 Tax=Apiospora kogelbergensis TaxID=1337665 RepID=A0AAW0QCA0_9PEZI
MAPASVMPLMSNLHTLGGLGVGSQRASGILEHGIMTTGSTSQREVGQGKTRSASLAMETSALSRAVYALKRRSDSELGSGISSQIMSESHVSILDWIGVQRMSHLPAEGSSYDKVLAWTQLFVERLHSFELAIEKFAGDSSLATQLAYGYCAILLKLGKDNASALTTSLGFFYSISGNLVDLLERAEMFQASHDIRGHLVLAMTDLVTLVASIATYFYKAIRSSSTDSTSINIYSTFAEQISTFQDRCNKIAESMWRHQLLAHGMSADKVSDVKSVQSWLAPEDRVLNNAAGGGGAALLAQDREELTCLWAGPHLTRFLRGDNKVLSISGKPGCGKTVASSVIVDYLQRPISGSHYDALYIPIDSNVPVETATRAVAKAIMSQLLVKRIGNTQLLQILSDACKTCQTVANSDEYDNTVWSALGRALGAALPGAKELVLVVDGIDDAACDEKSMFRRLVSAVAQGSNTQLITLGRAKFEGTGQSSLQITDGLIFDDIMAVVRSHFDSDAEFSSMSDFDQETIISQITEASAGSFLWAKMATKRLRRAVGLDKFRAAVAAAVKSKPTITDLVQQTVHTTSVSDEARHMLLWLATAERPLSVKELATLSCIQADKGTISDAHVDVLATLKHVQGLVCLQQGLMSIRHGLVRASLRELQAKGELVSTVTDAQADLATRLLFYIKTVTPEQHGPSADLLNDHDRAQLLNRFPLLDFAVRHWPVHLIKSTTFAKGGYTETAKTFSKVFPTTVTSLRLQATLWQYCPAPLLLAYHTTVTMIYRECFTVKSPLTLQCIIYLAILHRQIGRFEESASFFFEAASLSSKRQPADQELTIQMADTYIQMTDGKVSTTRTEFMKKREETLSILVECYTVKFGQASSQVVGTLRRLSEHYRSTKETNKYEQITKSIQTRMRIDSESGEISGTDRDLRVQLKGPKEVDTAEEGDLLLLDIEERDEKIVHSRDFTKEAQRCVSEGRIDAAEKCYLEAWQRASHEHSLHRSDMTTEKSIQALLRYSQFLQSQKRTTEASALLVGICEEYSSESASRLTETSASLLAQVSNVAKSMGLSSVSLAVSKLCMQHYRATNRTQTSAYKEAAESVQTITQEIFKSSNSSQTMASEKTLEETVYEYAGSISTMRSTTFASINSLISLHVSQRRWLDACRFIKKVLLGIWPSFFSFNVQDVLLVQEHTENGVGLVERLAELYSSRRRQIEEEDIRVRLYRSLRSGREVNDKLRERVTQELLSFYSKTSKNESGIAIRQEVLDDLIAYHGEQHPTVIKALWELAELTRPRPASIEYYQTIIRILNGNSKTSKPEALKPMIFVATELWSKGAFTEALPYYKTFFNTFFTAPKSSPIFQDQKLVRECFDHYLGCMRHSRTSFTLLHKITTEYHTQCQTIYGASTSIAVQAKLTLAKLCQESKATEAQAMMLFEELVKTGSKEIDLQEISSTLEIMQEEQATIIMEHSSSSSSSTAISSAQVDRAVTVLHKRFSSARETHGWAHEESLTQLSELVRFQSKQKDQSETVSRELKEATTNILSTEKSSTRLAAAASTIASSYMSSNMVSQATELTDELYRQVLMKDTSNVKASGFDLSSCGRESLIFIAQLEYSLRRSAATLTEIMAALSTQYAYFEELGTLFQSKSTNFLAVSKTVARIHQNLRSSGRLRASARVFHQYVSWAASTQSSFVEQAKMSPAQIEVFLQAILGHMGTHESHDMIRTAGIIGNTRLVELLDDQNYDMACDLGMACFKFIAVKPESYRTPVIAKLVLTMGIQLGSRAADDGTKMSPDARAGLLKTSRTILDDVLRVLMDETNVNLARLDPAHLDQLVSLLGAQENYAKLAQLLTVLWQSREVQQEWDPVVAFTLARRYILARYVVGDSRAALRIAEHIVYNCRRVHGLCHPATLEMAVLLSQLYSSVAQRHQKLANGSGSANGNGNMAGRYYRKSAAIHEDVLRSLTDPAYTSMDGGSLYDAMENGSSHGSNGSSSPSSPTETGFMHSVLLHPDAQQQPHRGGREHHSDGQVARRHLGLLKLALERAGDWPKGYAEYERLNADVFAQYSADLADVGGVEKWDLSGFGNGRAESDEDLVRATDLKSWQLLLDTSGRTYSNGGEQD